MAGADLQSEYQQYIARFDAAIEGTVEVGAFAKYKGKLVKKMAFEEFSTVYDEYHQLATHYFESLDRGDTINDVVVKTVRDNAAVLILTAPV